MPAPEPDYIVRPPESPISVALEPAHSSLTSLLLLFKIEHLSGLDEWVTRTAAALTPEQRHTNSLVMNGVYYAIVPERSFASFLAYVDHLAALDPTILRDRVLDAYAQIQKDGECCAPPDPLNRRVTIDTAPLLADVDRFLEFLGERFSEDHINVAIETEAHGYLNDPPALQALIVTHLRSMWSQILSPEWERVRPLLQTSVDAFQHLDLSKLSKMEAVQLVLGRDLEKAELKFWEAAFADTQRLVFVPCTHLGPYVAKFRAGNNLWVLFGARVPEGMQVHAPDLSRAEILVRLNALADDTRLRILKLVSEGGELRSQDIMARLDLSQSAASRHLKQLSATGYLRERRCEGAKCYSLNPERIEDTWRAISVFLMGK